MWRNGGGLQQMPEGRVVEPVVNAPVGQSASQRQDAQNNKIPTAPNEQSDSSANGASQRRPFRKSVNAGDAINVSLAEALHQ